MSVVFFGTSEFAVPSLRRIADRVSLVVTQPDRRSGRGLELLRSPIGQAAQELSITLAQPESCREESFLTTVRREGAKAFVVAAYGQILPRALLAVPEAGCFNLHGSLLPELRGAAPVQRAIQRDDTTTGVSLMLMEPGLDTGPVIAQSSTDIGEHETSGELLSRLGDIAADTLDDWLDRLLAGAFRAEPQEDSRATLAPKVEKQEARLRTESDLLEQYNAFRAFTPAPGAYLNTPKGPLKVLEARPERGDSTPGIIIATKPDLALGFNGGSLLLLRVQAPGKGPMRGVDYANGARLGVGDRLEG